MPDRFGALVPKAPKLSPTSHRDMEKPAKTSCSRNSRREMRNITKNLRPKKSREREMYLVWVYLEFSEPLELACKPPR
jgi:hypothetical protein